MVSECTPTENRRCETKPTDPPSVAPITTPTSKPPSPSTKGITTGRESTPSTDETNSIEPVNNGASTNNSSPSGGTTAIVIGSLFAIVIVILGVLLFRWHRNGRLKRFLSCFKDQQQRDVDHEEVGTDGNGGTEQQANSANSININCCGYQMNGNTSKVEYIPCCPTSPRKVFIIKTSDQTNGDVRRPNGHGGSPNMNGDYHGVPSGEDVLPQELNRIERQNGRGNGHVQTDGDHRVELERQQSSPPMPEHVFLHPIREKVIKMLDDQEDPLKRDAVMMGEKILHLDPATLDEWRRAESPATLLLQRWEADERSVADFIQGLRDMERDDMANDVEEAVA